MTGNLKAGIATLVAGALVSFGLCAVGLANTDAGITLVGGLALGCIMVLLLFVIGEYLQARDGQAWMHDLTRERNYRKLPKVIRAKRMTRAFHIDTLEGVMEGKPGDWLVTGAQGEQYPVTDARFRECYEVVV
jgi:hypothetical protein